MKEERIRRGQSCKDSPSHLLPVFANNHYQAHPVKSCLKVVESATDPQTVGTFTIPVQQQLQQLNVLLVASKHLRLFWNRNIPLLCRGPPTTQTKMVRQVFFPHFFAQPGAGCGRGTAVAQSVVPSCTCTSPSSPARSEKRRDRPNG